MVIKNKIVSFHRLSQFCEKHFCLCQTSTATKLTNQQKKSDENSKRSEMCLLFILCFVPLELPYQVKNVQYHWLYPTNKTITINASWSCMVSICSWCDESVNILGCKADGTRVRETWEISGETVTWLLLSVPNPNSLQCKKLIDYVTEFFASTKCFVEWYDMGS